jgi:hypothetical protein
MPYSPVVGISNTQQQQKFALAGGFDQATSKAANDFL